MADVLLSASHSRLEKFNRALNIFRRKNRYQFAIRRYDVQTATVHEAIERLIQDVYTEPVQEPGELQVIV